jgi:hypothetical protein
MGTTDNRASDDAERARQIVEKAEARDRDRETTREAVEQELEQEGLSDEGGHIGQHID